MLSAPDLLPGAAAPACERRREVRRPTTKGVVLRVVYPHVSSRFPVLILDESESGAGLFSDAPFHAGTIVQIQQPDKVWLAEVRHCRSVPGGFHVGVAIQREHTVQYC